MQLIGNYTNLKLPRCNVDGEHLRRFQVFSISGFHNNSNSNNNNNNNNNNNYNNNNNHDDDDDDDDEEDNDNDNNYITLS